MSHPRFSEWMRLSTITSSTLRIWDDSCLNHIGDWPHMAGPYLASERLGVAYHAVL